MSLECGAIKATSDDDTPAGSRSNKPKAKLDAINMSKNGQNKTSISSQNSARQYHRANSSAELQLKFTLKTLLNFRILSRVPSMNGIDKAMTPL